MCEEKQKWSTTKYKKEKAKTEQIYTKGKKKGGGDDKINTFKGVNSRTVTILGEVSIPLRRSPDKSILMPLIRRAVRNNKTEVERDVRRGGDEQRHQRFPLKQTRLEVIKE